MDAFLGQGKHSLAPPSDVLRGVFDATLDRRKPASVLKGQCKTCQHRFTRRQDRLRAHHFGRVIAVARSNLRVFGFYIMENP